MYKSLFSLLLILCCIACNETPATGDTAEAADTATETSADLSPYPEALQQVFARHGSLENWRKMKAMSYEIVEEEGENEKQFIDLRNRRERIEAGTFITGFDGTDFWLDADTTIYKGNPVFYHNLMFYFYAMPFVVADDGIIYSEADDLEFEGTNYPGIRIAYEDGVGVSSKDEYFVHYDPETYEMAWLGYTVTYFSKEVSTTVKWIRYDDWQTINGLSLPNSMTWYKVEEGQLIEPRKTVEFEDVKLSATAFEDSVFAKTEEAWIVE